MKWLNTADCKSALYEFGGSNPSASTICEPLAQLVEHLTFNQGVEGSSPSWLTSLFNQSQRKLRFFCMFTTIPNVGEDSMNKWIIRVIVFMATTFIGFGIAKCFDAIGKPRIAGIIYACSIVAVLAAEEWMRMKQNKQAAKQRI